jgi:hypothetical protein
MVNYENGKIYKIVCNKTGEIYIGSTCRTLEQRLYSHETYTKYCSSWKILKNRNYSIELIERFPCSSRLALEYRETYFQRQLKCVNAQLARRSISEWCKDNKEHRLQYKKQYREKNKEQISAREKIYREKNKESISAREKVYREKNKEHISKKNKNWRDNNKEHIIDYNKQYRTNNMDEIKTKKKVKVACECGSIIQNCNLARHYRTKKHQKYLLISQ